LRPAEIAGSFAVGRREVEPGDQLGDALAIPSESRTRAARDDLSRAGVAHELAEIDRWLAADDR
jgi:hypothetical protein